MGIALPYARYAIPVYYLIATAEASSNLARYDAVRYGHRAALASGDGLEQMYDRSRDEGFGAEVKRRIMLGTYVLSAGYYDAYYLKAQQVRTLLRQDYDRAFERCDTIAMPTTPTPAFRLGEKTSDPIQMYLSDVFTVTRMAPIFASANCRTIHSGTLVAQSATRSPRWTPRAINPRATCRASSFNSRNVQRSPACE